MHAYVRYARIYRYRHNIKTQIQKQTRSHVHFILARIYAHVLEHVICMHEIILF